MDPETAKAIQKLAGESGKTFQSVTAEEDPSAKAKRVNQTLGQMNILSQAPYFNPDRVLDYGRRDAGSEVELYDPETRMAVARIAREPKEDKKPIFWQSNTYDPNLDYDSVNKGTHISLVDPTTQKEVARMVNIAGASGEPDETSPTPTNSESETLQASVLIRKVDSYKRKLKLATEHGHAAEIDRLNTENEALLNEHNKRLQSLADDGYIEPIEELIELKVKSKQGDDTLKERRDFLERTIRESFDDHATDPLFKNLLENYYTTELAAELSKVSVAPAPPTSNPAENPPTPAPEAVTYVSLQQEIEALKSEISSNESLLATNPANILQLRVQIDAQKQRLADVERQQNALIDDVEGASGVIAEIDQLINAEIVFIKTNNKKYSLSTNDEDKARERKLLAYLNSENNRNHNYFSDPRLAGIIHSRYKSRVQDQITGLPPEIIHHSLFATLNANDQEQFSFQEVVKFPDYEILMSENVADEIENFITNYELSSSDQDRATLDSILKQIAQTPSAKGALRKRFDIELLGGLSGLIKSRIALHEAHLTADYRAQSIDLKDWKKATDTFFGYKGFYLETLLDTKKGSRYEHEEDSEKMNVFGLEKAFMVLKTQTAEGTRGDSLTMYRMNFFQFGTSDEQIKDADVKFTELIGKEMFGATYPIGVANNNLTEEHKRMIQKAETALRVAERILRISGVGAVMNGPLLSKNALEMRDPTTPVPTEQLNDLANRRVDIPLIEYDLKRVEDKIKDGTITDQDVVLSKTDPASRTKVLSVTGIPATALERVRNVYSKGGNPPQRKVVLEQFNNISITIKGNGEDEVPELGPKSQVIFLDSSWDSVYKKDLEQRLRGSDYSYLEHGDIGKSFNHRRGVETFQQLLFLPSYLHDRDQGILELRHIANLRLKDLFAHLSTIISLKENPPSEVADLASLVKALKTADGSRQVSNWTKSFDDANTNKDAFYKGATGSSDGGGIVREPISHNEALKISLAAGRYEATLNSRHTNSTDLVKARTEYQEAVKDSVSKMIDKLKVIYPVATLVQNLFWIEQQFNEFFITQYEANDHKQHPVISKYYKFKYAKTGEIIPWEPKEYFKMCFREAFLSDPVFREISDDLLKQYQVKKLDEFDIKTFRSKSMLNDSRNPINIGISGLSSLLSNIKFPI